MTQEERELLLVDLCGRLPYNVRFPMKTWDDKEGKIVEKIAELDVYNKFGYAVGTIINGPVKEYIGEIVKPYLFPMSSMTEEQKEELFKLCEFCIREDWEGKKSEVYAIEISSRFDTAYSYDHNFKLWPIDLRAIDFLNKNHFDYRGLIEKGLAIDATNLNVY